MKRSVEKLLCRLVLVLLISQSSTGLSAETASMEIDHLLHYIEQSGCIFIRNGKEYTAIEARQHIERKYEHVQNRVDSAEEFIQYAATGSSMSGRPYIVVCNGVEKLSGEWLKDELEMFRVEQR